MDINFKYKIGDWVAVNMPILLNLVMANLVVGQIISRTMEECSGGIQLKYTMQGYFIEVKNGINITNIIPSVINVHEMHLVNYQDAITLLDISWKRQQYLPITELSPKSN